MKKLLFVLQNILKIFIIFLIIFIWSRYFIRSFWWSLLTTSVLTLIIDIITRIISRKKNNKSSLKLKEKEEAEDMFFSLATNSNYMEFFNKLVASKYPSIEKKEKYIIINHSEKIKSILYPYLQFSSLTIDNLTEFLSKIQDKNVKKIVISCNEIDKITLAFAKNFDYEIVLLDKFDTYKHLYKVYEIYPDITMHYKKAQKLTMKDLIAYSFNRSRTKGYLFSAVILLLSSMFVRANLYYCIISSTLLLFALISYANPFYNSIGKEEIL